MTHVSEIDRLITMLFFCSCLLLIHMPLYNGQLYHLENNSIYNACCVML